MKTILFDYFFDNLIMEYYLEYIVLMIARIIPPIRDRKNKKDSCLVNKKYGMNKQQCPG
jgi:hypothetical protein